MRTFIIALLLPVAPVLAQGGPPPPPPLQPLQNPVAPALNPTTPAKVDLGRALFWDEQLSSTRMTACGSCHFSSAGGSDPRSVIGDHTSTNPGADGVYGTPDDVTASPGVVLSAWDGTYVFETTFGLDAQVTRRKAPSTVGAAYSPRQFWDGRAGTALVDPLTGQTVIANGAALEAQVLGPPTSTAEMGHVGRDWSDVAARIALSEPLALSPGVPADLDAWIADRSYPALFGEVFGTAEVTPVRIAMAIAAYERTLVPTQTPLDTFLATGQGLTPLENQGFQLFGQLNCAACHAGNRLTNDTFRYIGLRPQGEDLGRFEVTGVPADRGRFKVPTLRNVADRAPYMHTGQFATLADVVDFYDRGGDFNGPNKDPLIQPLNLTQQQKNALIAFLGRPLTDPRATNETGPFERPLLAREDQRMPTLFGTASAGTGGVAPHMVALEPPAIANPNLTIGIAGGVGGAPALLAADLATSPFGIDVAGATAYLALGPGLVVVPAGNLVGTGAGAGYLSRTFDLRGLNVPGLRLYAQWFVIDAGAPGGLLAATEAALFSLY
ncbi:Cytochrome c551 peroxidase precursor [Planctomycetes bacterium Pla163]|uniref:Cytochrome c551 peroxidase n=1 Tax=Rohdeia mirabilis TaxID=2528008 RepID=A0A518D0S5_9BACT|nr:Cytochrome c551 peroxidase precursor [Planctomycetes bacterium Pla163]